MFLVIVNNADFEYILYLVDYNRQLCTVSRVFLFFSVIDMLLFMINISPRFRIYPTTVSTNLNLRERVSTRV